MSEHILPGGPGAVPVAGRGRLACEALPDGEGVTLRIDDDDDPAFWCEVYLTAEDLRRLLRAVADRREGGAP